MLEGTQPKRVLVDGKEVENNDTMPIPFGFIQADYRNNAGSILYNDGHNITPFSMLGPNLDSQSGVSIYRARPAVRGMVDSGNTVNYFLMLEFGQNGITQPAGHNSGNYLTDASMTYSGLEIVYIRAGQFKYPGSEEGLQSVYVASYRNFTNVTNQLMMERFLPNNSNYIASKGVYQNAPTTSTGAFRDRGVEIFSPITLMPDSTLTLAVMVGSGTGLSSQNSSGKPTYYAYMAAEHLFGKGKGYFTQSAKAYIWYQNGIRRLENQDFVRIRYGLGFSYFRDGLRLGAEWMRGNGMIFNGTVDTDSNLNSQNWEWQIRPNAENEGSGWYVNLQYYIWPKYVEIYTRYDAYERLKNDATLYRTFNTTTVGATYHFKGATRVDVNYMINRAYAPYNETAQNVLNAMGNMFSTQVTVKF